MLAFKLPDSTRHNNTARLSRPRPPTPAPTKMSASYEPVFDSEDEFASSCSGSSGSSDLIFSKRPITPTPPSSRSSSMEVKKPVSLLTLGLSRSQATVALTTSDDEDFASSDSDDDASDTSSVYMPISQQVVMELPSPGLRSASGALVDALAELDQRTTRYQLVATTRAQAPRQTGIITTLKKTITTNLKWYGKITTGLCYKHQASNHGVTTPLLPPRQTTQTIPNEEDAYRLFFGTDNNNHTSHSPGLTQRPCHRPIPPALQLHPRSSGPGPTSTPAMATPLSQEQREKQREGTELTIDTYTAWTNDQLQIRRAGPLEVLLVSEIIEYVERDCDWVCCGCCNVNSRYEFLCWWCKGHVKGGCCEEAVEGVDGVAGWGVGVA